MRVGGESNRSLKNIILKSKEDYKAMKNNDLPAVTALLGKNLSKIPQFFKK
jgi:glycosyltransferase